jgi:hypothetical protein
MSESRAPVMPTALHGGHITTTRANAFETVFASDGIRIYRYDETGAPAVFGDSKGSARMRTADGARSKIDLVRRIPEPGDGIWFCPMHAQVIQSRPGACQLCGMQLFAHDYLFVPAGEAFRFEGAAAGPIEIEVKLKGLGDPENKATFAESGYPGRKEATL